MPPVKRQRSASPVTAAVPLERLYPSAGPTPKPPKKIKGEDGVVIPPAPVEKRLKLYKKSESSSLSSLVYFFPADIRLVPLACPKATQERVDRVMCQRFFCIGRERTSETSEDFKVLGSTGNVYTIRICNVSTCDCPDGQKGNHCKHIVRSLQIERNRKRKRGTDFAKILNSQLFVYLKSERIPFEIHDYCISADAIILTVHSPPSSS